MHYIVLILVSLQLGFIGGICLPCYDLLVQVLPNTGPMQKQCLKNLETWKERADARKKEQEEEKKKSDEDKKEEEEEIEKADDDDEGDNEVIEDENDEDKEDKEEEEEIYEEVNDEEEKEKVELMIMLRLVIEFPLPIQLYSSSVFLHRSSIFRTRIGRV